MKVAYRDDERRGPGNGALVFSEAMLPDAPWEIAIQRGSDHAYLSGGKSAKWMGEAIFIPLEGEAATDGSLCLRIGPDIVNSLDQMDQYQVYLKNAGSEPLKGRLRVESITYSPGGSRDNTARVEKQEPVAVEGAAAAMAGSRQEPAASAANPDYGPEALKDSLELSPPPAAKSPRKAWRWVFLGILAAACLVWFILDPGHLLESGGKPGPVSIEEPPAPAAPARPAAKTSERVAKFFASPDHSPQAAFDLSQELPKTSQADQDAVYRLYYYAAENNLPGALMVYAACIDPSRPQWGTIEKDAPLAWSIYEKARNAEPGAVEAQQHLMRWLREQAGEGNDRARSWLRETGK